MTSKELVLKALKFEETERTPFAVLNGQMWICARNNLTVAQLLELPDAGAQLLVDAYKEIGTDILTTGCAAAWPMITAMGGTIDMNTIAAEIITRPLSEISEIDDYDVNEVIAKIRDDYWYQRTLVQAKEMRRLVGEEYLIGGGFFGPFTVAAQLLGVDDFMVELFEDEDGYVEKIIDFCIEIVAAYLDDLVECGLDLITDPEPVASGDLISPDMFEEFVVPTTQKLLKRLEGKGDASLIHICGKTGRIISDVAETGMSVVSIDTIDLEKAVADADGKIAIFGDLNPAAVLMEKSADEVYEIAKARCELMKPYGGYILAPGCDLAPAIPLENLQAMARAAKETM